MHEQAVIHGRKQEDAEMLKLTVAALAVALAGAASADGWRSMRVDGSSEASFAESIAAFEKKLPPARRDVFMRALQDIRAQGKKAAEADQREYTDSEYLRQIDGLRYDEVVTFTDPTGDTAEFRYRVAYARLNQGAAASEPARAVPPAPMRQPGPTQTGRTGEQERGLPAR
jgi:hypothetical protein